MRIAISLGDVTGIGPEVTLKALASELSTDDAKYLLIGDAGGLAGLKPADARIQIHDQLGQKLPTRLPPSSPEAARAAVAWLQCGAEMCLKGEADALVTAPVSKEAIIRAGIDFVGQTEFLSAIAGTKDTAMMLLGTDERGRWLRVALATTHVPLRSVADHLTMEKIVRAIRLAATACQQLGLSRARIGVCGLNPHAGEGGKLGTEEITIITPAIEDARGLQIDVEGPLPADTLFHRALKGDFDAVIAMYHDQGLAPLKMIAFDTGVNWTLGLPFIRTSPDHGTAYDIAGKGIANPSSMISAIRLAKQLVRARSSDA